MDKKETMLIKVDPKANNNKFYHVILHENGHVEKRWGRVGSAGSSAKEQSGEKGYERLIREKKKKGYKETEVLSTTPRSASTEELSLAANHSLIKGTRNAELESLIENLVNNNRHDIIEQSGGEITLDDDGKVKTPLGYITLDNIKEARKILSQMEKKDTSDLLSDYLTLVPQKVPYKRGWDDEFFTKYTSFSAQSDFLDKLQDSYEWAETELKAKKEEKTEDTDVSKYDSFFRFQIELLDDHHQKDEIFSHVQRYYEESKNSRHHSSNFKLSKVFLLHDESKEAEFQRLSDAYGNVRELWHGTSASNVLSILKSGLYAAKGNQISHGNMYAGNIPMTYLSDQSSKSLNYSSGFWNRRDGSTNKCYMFLTDTVMGNEFRPHEEGFTHHDSSIGKKAVKSTDKNGRSYNSISVKGGTVGVINNEMLIWNPDQIRLKYLCEFIM